LLVSLLVFPLFLTHALAAEPPLIPRKVLLGNPKQAAPQLSPDGKTLAYIAPDKNDALQVWVKPVSGGDAHMVTAEKKRDIHVFLWTYMPDVLAYLQDNDGDENYHIYAVNLANKNVRDMTPFQGVRAQPVGTDRHFPTEMLVGLNLNNRRVFDVYRIN